MDILKAEIERKKQQLSKANVVPENKKYFKRADLSAKQEEEYWSKSKRAKNEKQPSSTPEGKTSDESVKSDIPEASTKPTLSRKEVVRRLRERNEPILLFGESEYESYQRLKKLEILTPEVEKGYKNDLKAAMDKVDQQYLNELSMGSESGARNAYNVTVKDAGMLEEDMPIMAEDLGQGNSDEDQSNLLKFLKFVLQKWGEELNARPDDVKKSQQGKMEAATFSQTVSYLRPLFLSFKNKSCAADILICLVDVCKHMLVRDYISANEAYMEMAVGNAPWPIGVTMVGIHARTGREKIFDKNVAHVLNDETQRKYIQAVKRLMTKCQRFFPGRLSRMVNYERAPNKN